MDPNQRGLDLINEAVNNTIGRKIHRVQMHEHFTAILFENSLKLRFGLTTTFQHDASFESIPQKHRSRLFQWLDLAFGHAVTAMSISEKSGLETVFDNGLIIRVGYQNPAEDIYEQYEISYDRQNFIFGFRIFDYWDNSRIPRPSRRRSRAVHHRLQDQQFLPATKEESVRHYLDLVKKCMKETLGNIISFIEMDENGTKIIFENRFCIRYGLTAQYTHRGLSEEIPYKERAKVFERLSRAYDQAVTDLWITEGWQLHLAFANGLTVDIGYRNEAEADLKQYEIEFEDKKFVFSGGAFEVIDL